MASPCSTTDLQDFLIAAKQASYASSADDASLTPLLSGTKQLEYRSGDFFYRDIYAGLLMFVGQEIVYFRDTPVWSMSYAGGTLSGVDMDQVRDIYALLRQALRQVPKEQPFRGPEAFDNHPYCYRNEISGSVERFHGQERITASDKLLYELRYSGGMLC